MATESASDRKGFDSSKIAGKYLTFALGAERYGLEILKVQEIIGVIRITKVPKSPTFMKGVINLRGKIIPVVDLRLRFDMEEREYDKKTCVIVVNARLGEQTLAVGVVVDTVLEVINFDESNIQPTPDYGKDDSQGFIVGLGKAQENVIILIDIDQVLAGTSEDLLMHVQ
jgi:purine-binding chemotaxis protein CheW